MKAKLSFISIVISNSQIETLVSYSRSTNINENMSFPTSNVEAKFSTYVFWQVILTLSRSENWLLGIATYIMRKVLNPFLCVDVRILVEKINIYIKFTFSRGHYYKHADWKRLFVFKYPFTFKPKLHIIIIFIEINENVCLLCAHHIMKGIIIHTRRPNCQWKVCYELGIYVSTDYLFSHFEKLKTRFSHRSLSAHQVCTKDYQVLGGQ